jgi:putative FmdB family regulatory protein
MPTYGYICEDCGYEFEQFQSIKAPPRRKCPICKKTSLKRLIGSGSALIFKGSGFYETDYRSENYKKAENKEKNSTNTSAEKRETKSKASQTPEKIKSSTKNKNKSA